MTEMRQNVDTIQQTNDKSQKCDSCEYSCSTKRFLQIHMRMKHNTGPIKLLVCPKCEYSTCLKGNFTKHTRSHTMERPFSCEYCYYRANENINLKRHLRTKHNTGPVKLLRCAKCEYTTSTMVIWQLTWELTRDKDHFPGNTANIVLMRNILFKYPC